MGNEISKFSLEKSEDTGDTSWTRRLLICQVEKNIFHTSERFLCQESFVNSFLNQRIKKREAPGSPPGRAGPIPRDPGGEGTPLSKAARPLHC